MPRSGGKAHEDSIGSIAYNPDGSLLASCGNDGTVAIWKSASGELAARSARAGCYLEDLAFSRDGELVYAVGADGYLRAWSSEDADPRFAVKMSDDRLWALSRAGSLVYVTGSSGEIRSLDFSESIWEKRAREIVGTDISGAP
jgi:WD40 repeat protein